MAKTLNQVIKSLNDIADNHQQLNHFFFGEMYDFATSGDTQYPAMAVEKEPDLLEGSTLKMNFNLYFIDLVHKDISNRQEVLSDMQSVALDVIYQLTHPDYDWVIDSSSITLNDFVDRFDDEVTGYWFKLTLKISSPFDRCAIPQTPLSIATTICAPVSIYNSAGTLIATVASGGSYTESGSGGGAGTINLYLDGVLQSSTASSDLNAEIVNVLWT